MTVSRDEQSNSLFRTTLMGISALLEDTSLGMFNFCLEIEEFKESRSFVVLFIEGFDSYVP